MVDMLEGGKMKDEDREEIEFRVALLGFVGGIFGSIFAQMVFWLFEVKQ